MRFYNENLSCRPRGLKLSIFHTIRQIHATHKEAEIHLIFNLSTEKDEQVIRKYELLYFASSRFNFVEQALHLLFYSA